MDSSDQRFASSDFVPKHRPWLLGRLLGYLRPYKWWVLISVLLGVLTIGSGVALLATSAWLISAAALQPSIADLSLAIVGVRFFGISRGIFRYLERLASHSVTFRLLANLRTSFYASLEPLAPAVFLRYQSGELFSRIVSDVEGLKEFYVRVIAPPAVATVISAAILIFLANFHPLLAIGLLPFVLAAGLVLPGVVGKMTRGTGKDLVTIRASFQSKLADNILGMADLLVFDQERLAANEIFMLSRRFVILQRRLARTRAFHAGSNVLLSNLALLVILLSAVVLTGQGKLDAVYLATLTLATWAAFEAYQPLPAAAENLESSLQVAERLYEITSAPADVIDLLDPLPPAESANLVVKNLRFKYQSAGPWILDGFNLDLPRGKWVAIVGPSGSGKSTITNILLRLWEYQAGHIEWDGVEVKNYRQADVRRLFGMVGQDCHLFNAPVDQNIEIARPGASVNEIRLAAEKAQLDDFIQSLPEGYHTLIGELGMRFSGGQRQRLLLARAIVRDSPILMLDEPTANLDILTERRVMATIFALSEGRSLLLMTHRLLGLEQMDEILVLKDGRIAEQGLHEDLVAAGGIYAHMWELQHRASV